MLGLLHSLSLYLSSGFSVTLWTVVKEEAAAGQ